MRRAIPSLPQYLFVAWCLVNIMGVGEASLFCKTPKFRNLFLLPSLELIKGVLHGFLCTHARMRAYTRMYPRHKHLNSHNPIPSKSFCAILLSSQFSVADFQEIPHQNYLCISCFIHPNHIPRPSELP